MGAVRRRWGLGEFGGRGLDYKILELEASAWKSGEYLLPGAAQGTPSPPGIQLGNDSFPQPLPQTVKKHGGWFFTSTATVLVLGAPPTPPPRPVPSRRPG